MITYYDIEKYASENKRLLEYFEAEPLEKLTIYEDDDTRIRHIKEQCNSCGSLYMERNATAFELAERWSEQGWTPLVVRRTHWGHLGPKFLGQLNKIVRGMEIGDWTMAPVERCWSVVFATKAPEDIKVFIPLLLPADR